MGRQLTWFLRALADLPLSQQVIRAHFDSGVLAHISAEQLNSALAQPSAPGGASLLGLLWEDPARDPVSLLAVAAFGSVTLTVDVAVDRAGLIDTLLLGAYQPPPGSWVQVDRELAALAPDASLLAARVSPGGSCTRSTRWLPRPPGRSARCSSCSSWARLRTGSPRGGSRGTRN